MELTEQQKKFNETLQKALTGGMDLKEMKDLVREISILDATGGLANKEPIPDIAQKAAVILRGIT